MLECYVVLRVCVCVCVCGRLCSVSSRAAGAATQVRHQYSPGLVISLSLHLSVLFLRPSRDVGYSNIPLSRGH